MSGTDPTGTGLPHEFESVASLISALGNVDDGIRWNARQALIAQRPAAVPELIKGLKNPSILVRWEVTQILATIADPAAAPALVETLADDDSGVRWSAVGALIALKEHALTPLLEGLIYHSNSNLIIASAHHVLKNIPLSDESRSSMAPVLDTLSGPAPELQAPFVARTALLEIQGRQR